AVAGGFVSQSVSYLDVGLQLEVEPLIYLEDDVGIKVGLEVSNITNTIPQTGGGLVYQIGTRKTSTVLRLRDGETQILAGLINARPATPLPPAPAALPGAAPPGGTIVPFGGVQPQ